MGVFISESTGRHGMWLTVLNISQKRKGIIGRIWDFLLEHPNILIGVAYLYTFFLGMMYALSYYQSFKIDIFAFAEPLDFLLITFSKAGILFGILLGILLVLAFAILIILILLPIFFLISTIKSAWAWIVNVGESIKNYVSWVGKSIGNCGVWVKNIFILLSFTNARENFTENRKNIKKGFDNSNKEIKDKLDTSRKEAVDSFHRNLQTSIGLFRRSSYLVIFTAALFLSFILPGCHAKQDAQTLISGYPINQDYNALYSYYSYSVNRLQSVVLGKEGGQQKPRHVQVTIRQDALQPKTRLPIPDRTFLIGTTSSFHFFYECEKALTTENGADAQVRWWNALKAENGPFAKLVQGRERSTLKPVVSVRWNTVEEARPKCEKGRPFIIPTANIASLEFNPSPVDTGPKPPVTDNKVSLETFHTIWSFPEAEHDQIENDEEKKLTALFDEMKNKFEKHVLQRMMLIGRVDISLLSDEKRDFYGSNDGLAQARAKWVRDKLVENFEDEEQKDALKRALLLSAGPLHVGEEATESNRKKDRGVEVWAYWTPKPKPASPAESPPDPATDS